MALLQGTYIQCGCVNDGTFTQFASARKATIDMDRDMQEISSTTTGDDKEYIPMRKGWKMSVGCLLTDDESAVYNAYNNATKLTVSWRDTKSAFGKAREFTGLAYIKGLKSTGNIREMATFDIELQGTGGLTYQIISGDQ